MPAVTLTEKRQIVITAARRAGMGDLLIRSFIAFAPFAAAGKQPHLF